MRWDPVECVPPGATCAVRGHPPGEFSYFRWFDRPHRATLGVGGHIGPVELDWPYMRPSVIWRNGVGMPVEFIPPDGLEFIPPDGWPHSEFQRP